MKNDAETTDLEGALAPYVQVRQSVVRRHRRRPHSADIVDLYARGSDWWARAQYERRRNAGL